MKSNEKKGSDNPEQRPESPKRPERPNPIPDSQESLRDDTPKKNV